MQLKNKTILIISNEPWGDIWYSKHNWANELSKNNLVYFIDPPKKWKFVDFFKTKINIENYSDSLKILRYNNKLPFTRFDFLFKINERCITRKINKNVKSINKIIFWSFDPYRFSRPALLKSYRSIYFRVDEYIVKREATLIKNVDEVILTSKELLKNITPSKKPLIITHGISEEEFEFTSDIKYKKGYFLYVGNIDYRLDIDLIEKILIEFPNEIFIFIGKLNNINNKKFQEIFYENKYNNIIIHGVEHFKNLKNYIYKSKGCLAPMDLNIHGNSIHHHKTLQYLAMGKPIISPIFNDEINKEHIIVSYKNNDEAIQRIREIDLYNSNEQCRYRINYAKQFLYSNLIKKIEKFIN